jgi:hypothetical protein
MIVHPLRRVTRLPLEIHLMISNPDAFLGKFVEAGADSLPVHWEGIRNLHRTIQRITALEKRAGVVINPATSVARLEEILQDVEQVFIITVTPGFRQQHFLPTTPAHDPADPSEDRAEDVRRRPGGGRRHRGRHGSVGRSRRHERAGGWNRDFWAMDRLRASITQSGTSTSPSRVATLGRSESCNWA